MNSDDIKKLNSLAADVMHLSRNTLLVHLRFMDMALSMLSLVPCDAEDLFVDGENIIYHPLTVLKRYKAEKEVPVRDYLHMVMHCVFRHMYITSVVNYPYWDLACDIAVENVINELNLSAANAGRAKRQVQFINALKQELKLITAEKIYAYLIDNYSEDELERIRKDFYADNHDIWRMSDKDKQQLGISSSSNNQQQNEKQNNKDNTDSEEDNQSDSDNPQGDNENQNTDGENQNEQNESSDDSQDGDSGESENDNSSQSDYMSSVSESLSEQWKEIAERMQTDMETFSKDKGDTAGGLIQNLREVTREKYDYTSFLKKFAVLGETMKINDDEFDYIFYTYGLKLYKNVPLIEPLEYKEEKRIKEFVIAIDTSGSVSGDLVQMFLQKTYNILKSTESFFSKINVHIIQCDTQIHEDKKITSQDEFDNYINTMQLKGFGGTDFRPVFEYVNELVENKEFTNLRGLIYFTDGCGDFPSQMPLYSTAFVFIDDEYNNYDVPPWAIKLILQSNDI